jgi:GNAT superfamily N-acetyltransferase
VSRRVAPLTLDVLDDLPTPCRTCVFWELDQVAGARAEEAGDTGFEKEAWLSAVLLEWGSAGRLLYVDDAPAGYVLYAPPAFVPRSVAFPTSPVSDDAVLLMAATVLPEHRDGGLGRVLVQAVAKDLTRRGVRAIEAFGRPSGTREQERCAVGGCLVPADFLLAVGFKTVRPHPKYPRLRLDLKSVLSWREDVEHAIEKIFAPVRSPALG